MKMSAILDVELRHQLARCRQVQWMLTAALAVSAAAIYLMEIRPISNDLDRTRQRYAVVQSDLRLDLAQAGNLPAVEAEIDRLRQSVDRLDKKLPRQSDIAPFINDITRIKDETALKNLNYYLDSALSRNDQFSIHPIRFTFEGDFKDGVVEFLRRTEELPRLTRIEKMQMRSDEAHSGQVKVDLTMNIYFAEE